MDASKTEKDLGWPELISAWAKRCRTSRGAEAALSIAACADASEAQERVREVAEARMLEDRGQPMPFGGITDVRLSVMRARKGSALEAEELVAIADSARGYFRLREELEMQQEDVPRLWERGAGIGDFEALYIRLGKAFEPDGRIADNASATIGPLRKKVLRLQQNLEAKAKSLIDDPTIQSELQDTYWTQRDDRYVLPVRASARSKIPGVVHGSSGSGQTVFVEPNALVDLNNELKLAEYEVLEEEQRILAALSEMVSDRAGELKTAADIVVRLDVIGGAAQLANHLRAHEPVFAGSREISLRRARHPLMVLSGKECVANDIRIDEGKILIISGPNAGGKTVSLKTLGLAVMMSRYGLHIAAGEGSELPWFEGVVSAIGDSQSLESELSTFSAHLTHLRQFLKHAGKGTLVLIDEICSATEPEQGGALAQAVMEELADRRVTALVTTHYERLKALATEDERFENASVGFDLELMAPTFRLHLGVPGASAAIDVARRMALPEDVLARATTLSGGGRTKLDELLRTVSDERERLADERTALEEERAATAKAYEEARRTQQEADAKARAQHEKDHDGAMRALRQARQELEQAKASFKRRKTVDANAISQHKQRLNKLGSKVAAGAPQRPEPEGQPPRAEELSPGSQVRVLSLGNKGEVVDAPDKGMVLVQVGIMKTKVALSDLRLVEGGAKRKRSARASYQVSMNQLTDDALVRSPDSTLDLRGERAHEALSRVDRFLDSSLLCAREAVFIVHGHGTGALRQAVREYLEAHHCVSKWRKGEANEGGDGVTVAWLSH